MQHFSLPQTYIELILDKELNQLNFSEIKNSITPKIKENISLYDLKSNKFFINTVNSTIRRIENAKSFKILFDYKDIQKFLNNKNVIDNNSNEFQILVEYIAAHFIKKIKFINLVDIQSLNEIIFFCNELPFFFKKISLSNKILTVEINDYIKTFNKSRETAENFFFNLN